LEPLRKVGGSFYQQKEIQQAEGERSMEKRNPIVCKGCGAEDKISWVQMRWGDLHFDKGDDVLVTQKTDPKLFYRSKCGGDMDREELRNGWI